MMSLCFQFDLCLQLAGPTEEEAIEVTSLATLGALSMALKGRAVGRRGGDRRGGEGRGGERRGEEGTGGEGRGEEGRGGERRGQEGKGGERREEEGRGGKRKEGSTAKIV